MNKLQDSESMEVFAALRAYAEQELSNHSAPMINQLPVDQLVEELQIHQIELEMQNESLRQAQAELEQSRDRYRDLYEYSPIGYMTLNRLGVINEINLTATAMLGRDRSELLNRHFAPLVASEDADRWYLFVKDALKKEAVTVTLEITINRPQGALIARVDCVNLKTGEGPASLRVALTDITASKHAETELRVAAIAFESQEAMMVTDIGGNILRVNSAFMKHTGYSAAELVGKTPAILKSGRHDAFFYQQMWALLKKNGSWSGTIWNRYKNGKIYAEWLNLSAVYAANGVITHYVGSYSSIAQNREAEAEIHRLAYYDSLTLLPNRRFLQERIEQSMLQCTQNGCHGAVLFADLDNFKTLNDTHGHDIGDLLLTMVARRLVAAMPAESTVARLSGDEFVIVLDNLSSMHDEATEQVRHVADRLCAALTQPYDLGNEYRCTVSMGIVLYQDQHQGVKRLLKRADLALYQAKSAGRNQVQFFDEDMQNQLEARKNLIHDLRQALALNQLHLYYQVQVDHLYRIVSAEALLRWAHPRLGMLEPDIFIPLAEETGLILPIGQWVLTTACQQIRNWNERAGKPIHLSVNVSARQFRQPDFIDCVKRVLAETGADPRCLDIELTESVVISNIEDTISKMHALKEMGIRLSMDDFGTGYSSLSTLSSLPLDQVKIDQSFVQKLNIRSDTNNEIVTQSIITLGRMLGLHVIAEGVETYSQLDFLERHGCHAYQGYLFGRPLTLNHLETALL